MGLWLGLRIRVRVRAIVSVRVRVRFRVSVNLFNFHIYFGVCGFCIWKVAGAFFLPNFTFLVSMIR